MAFRCETFGAFHFVAVRTLEYTVCNFGFRNVPHFMLGIVKCWTKHKVKVWNVEIDAPKKELIANTLTERSFADIFLISAGQVTDINACFEGLAEIYFINYGFARSRLDYFQSGYIAKKSNGPYYTIRVYDGLESKLIQVTPTATVTLKSICITNNQSNVIRNRFELPTVLFLQKFEHTLGYFRFLHKIPIVIANSENFIPNTSNLNHGIAPLYTLSLEQSEECRSIAQYCNIDLKKMSLFTIHDIEDCILLKFFTCQEQEKIIQDCIKLRQMLGIGIDNINREKVHQGLLLKLIFYGSVDDTYYFFDNLYYCYDNVMYNYNDEKMYSSHYKLESRKLHSMKMSFYHVIDVEGDYRRAFIMCAYLLLDITDKHKHVSDRFVKYRVTLFEMARSLFLFVKMSGFKDDELTHLCYYYLFYFAVKYDQHFVKVNKVEKIQTNCLKCKYMCGICLLNMNNMPHNVDMAHIPLKSSTEATKDYDRWSKFNTDIGYCLTNFLHYAQFLFDYLQDYSESVVVLQRLMNFCKGGSCKIDEPIEIPSDILGQINVLFGLSFEKLNKFDQAMIHFERAIAIYQYCGNHDEFNNNVVVAQKHANELKNVLTSTKSYKQLKFAQINDNEQENDCKLLLFSICDYDIEQMKNIFQYINHNDKNTIINVMIKCLKNVDVHMNNIVQGKKWISFFEKYYDNKIEQLDHNRYNGLKLAVCMFFGAYYTNGNEYCLHDLNNSALNTVSKQLNYFHSNMLNINLDLLPSKQKSHHRNDARVGIQLSKYYFKYLLNNWESFDNNDTAAIKMFWKKQFKWLNDKNSENNQCFGLHAVPKTEHIPYCSWLIEILSKLNRLKDMYYILHYVENMVAYNFTHKNIGINMDVDSSDYERILTIISSRMLFKYGSWENRYIDRVINKYDRYYGLKHYHDRDVESWFPRISVSSVFVLNILQVQYYYRYSSTGPSLKPNPGLLEIIRHSMLQFCQSIKKLDKNEMIDKLYWKQLSLITIGIQSIYLICEQKFILKNKQNHSIGNHDYLRVYNPNYDCESLFKYLNDNVILYIERNLKFPIDLDHVLKCDALLCLMLSYFVLNDKKMFLKCLKDYNATKIKVSKSSYSWDIAYKMKKKIGKILSPKKRIGVFFDDIKKLQFNKSNKRETGCGLSSDTYEILSILNNPSENNEKFELWKNAIMFDKDVRLCNYCQKFNVNGHLRVCSGCKKVRYCNRVCQKKDWKFNGHKIFCVK